MFGEGSRDARIVLVGEQPGDREDIEGEPFCRTGRRNAAIGDRRSRASIRPGVYVTNAVKHFPLRRAGETAHPPKASRDRDQTLAAPGSMQRLPPSDRAPSSRRARPPRAACSACPVRIGDRRGKPLIGDGRTIFVTIHPASVLRQPDRDARRSSAFARLVADLRAAGKTAR